MNVKYQYSISNDFPNSKVDSLKLITSIQTSTILTALDCINTGGDDCDIWFKESLSIEDQSTLDGLVAAHDGVTIVTPEAPRDLDNKPLVISDRFPLGMQTHWGGVDDDLENGIRFGGDSFKLSMTTQGECSRDCRYLELIHIAGAEAFCWEGVTVDDWVTFLILAPATPAIENIGSGTYSKLPIGGGINMFVPPGIPGAGDADWDIDLTEKYNSNVNFLKVVPVPASNKNGFFNYNSISGVMTYNSSGSGSYNLFDSEIPLSNKVSKRHLLPQKILNFIDESIQTKVFFPHWVCRISVYNSSDKVLTVSWDFYTGRYDLT